MQGSSRICHISKHIGAETLLLIVVLSMNKQRLMLLDPSQFTDVQGHLILSASAIFNIHCCSANSSNRIESRGVSKMGEDILGIGH